MSDDLKPYHLLDGPLAGSLCRPREGGPPARVHVGVAYFIPEALAALPKHKPSEELPAVRATLVYRFERTAAYHEYVFESLEDE